MNYVQFARESLDARLDLDPDLIRFYPLLLLVRGEDTTLEDVHDAWAIWCNETNPEHTSIIEFGDLAVGVQKLDRPYMEAIHAAAAELWQ